MKISDSDRMDGDTRQPGDSGEKAATRRCVVCGEEAPARGGKQCENGHFVCARPECQRVGFFSEIRRVICPICARLLR